MKKHLPFTVVRRIDDLERIVMPKEIIRTLRISEYYEITKAWYDGYRIGSVDTYCPWDVVNWCRQLMLSSDKEPKNYWATIFIEKIRKVSGETCTEAYTEISTEAAVIERTGNTPYEKYGKLSVIGKNLVGADGNSVTLQGVSIHGIAWFPQYIDKEGFRTLRDNMNTDVIRLAVYSGVNEGYSKDLYEKVDAGVSYAQELGMYAIIDWHVLENGNPNTDKENAKEFFTYMAQKYCDSENVLYEICNEPNGDVQWERDIKPYAEEIINIIRQYDDDGIIIVGTPTWSQDVDIAAQSPIENQTNIMYTFHFYAATHGEALRNKLSSAVEAGLPVFVTEFGISEAS